MVGHNERPKSFAEIIGEIADYALHCDLLDTSYRPLTIPWTWFATLTLHQGIAWARRPMICGVPLYVRKPWG